MTFVQKLVACCLLLFPVVYSKVTYENPLVRSIGEEVVFQWNSTQPIYGAYWGTMRNNSQRLSLWLIYKDANKPPEVHQDIMLFTYKGRVSFVGNLTAGHAWFKLRNLTLDDSIYYGARIRLEGQRQQLYSTFLKVQDVRFIQVPPDIQYVAKGQTATFSWDYFPVKKGKKLLSRLWEVYSSVNGWKTIGAEHSTSGWQWKLSASCPARLKNPTRVSKASTASLVIYDVTIEDSGLYRCNLILRGRPPVTSTTQLIVTVGPQFTSTPPPSKYIAEGQHLKLLCSAIGPPTPNVTWVRVQGVSKVTVSHGVGNASLSISNITRKQTGRYECQAANNPNQRPVTARTNINVMSDKPSIDYPTSDTTVTSETSDYPTSDTTVTSETSDDHNEQPGSSFDNVRDPIIIIIGVLVLVFVVGKCCPAKKTKERSNSTEMSDREQNNDPSAAANSFPATIMKKSMATLKKRLRVFP